MIKPAQGAGGDGILVIADRFEGRYRTVSGKIISHEEIEHQISSILTGLYSLGGHRDRALIEYRVVPDQIFKSISYEGVPDIRIIVLMGYPVMAMLGGLSRSSRTRTLRISLEARQFALQGLVIGRPDLLQIGCPLLFRRTFDPFSHPAPV